VQCIKTRDWLIVPDLIKILTTNREYSENSCAQSNEETNLTHVNV